MHLGRMKTLSFISVLALTTVFACSSKKNNGDDTVAEGGGGYQLTGGTANNGGGASVGGSDAIPDGYCNNALSGLICSQTRLQADVRQVNMMLVIDMSGSMKDPPTSSATQSKWSQMSQALPAALKDVAKDIDFGLELFPYSGDPANPGVGSDPDPATSCMVPAATDPNAAIVVDIAPGIDHFNSIVSVINSSTPAGGTPTTAALQQAYRYFTEGNGKDLKGTKWVLLATDGAPNCNVGMSCNADGCTQNIDCKCGSGCNETQNCCAPDSTHDYGYICLDDQAVKAQITKMASAGIKTFVVGIPGSEKFTATLNSMAQAGGMPKVNSPDGNLFYAVSAANSLQDLQTAFSDITTQLVKSCDIALQESPRDKKQVVVLMDCNKLNLVDDNTPEDGPASGFWVDYTTYAPDPAHLKLTGSVCSTIRTQGAMHLDVVTGCQNVF